MSDPVRLSRGGDGAPDALRELLGAAKADLPSSAALERLASRLPLDAPLPPPAPPAPAPSQVGAGVAGKTVAAAVVIGAIVGGALWLSRPGAPTPPPRVETTAEPAVQTAPATPQSVAPSGPVAVEKPRPVVAPKVPGVSEAALLRQAQAALRSDPARALALTQEHRRRFPQGALVQEREVIAIDALSRLGRSGEASNRAKDFEKSYPGSAHQKKVETTVEGSRP